MVDTSFHGRLNKIFCTGCDYYKRKINIDDIRHREKQLNLREMDAAKSEFASTLRVVGELRAITYNRDMVVVLNSVLRAIKLTVQYDFISTILFRDGLPINHHVADILCCAHDDARSDVEHDWMYTEVHLDKDIVFAIPWQLDRLQGSLLNIFKNPFRHDIANHEAYYYPTLGITCVRSGLHSVAAGILNKKGKIYARIVDDDELLERYYCDARNMYEKGTGKSVRAIGDYRIGLIFELTRMLGEFI